MSAETNPWPADDLEHVDTCPVCGSQQRSPLHQSLKDHLFGASGTWTLYRCTACNSAYLDPRPTPSSIGRAYAQYYTHVGSDAPINFLKQLSRRARNGYLNRNWGSQLEPASPWLGKIVAAVPSLRAKADHELMRSFPRTEKGRSLLDVGCGSGQFLELMKAAGWNVSGIDIDEKAVASARRRGLDVAAGGLELYADRQEIFDAITLSHVIEHVYDPLGVLQNCYRLLKKGGRLWIETPNIESQGHVAFNRHWRGLEPPRHLLIFNRNSLKTMLEKVGFTNVSDAPWRAEFKSLMNESIRIRDHEEISQGNPSEHLNSASIRQKERMAAQSPEHREYITFVVFKL